MSEPSIHSQQSVDVERLTRRVELLAASLRSATSALADVTRQVEGVQRDLAAKTGEQQ